MPFFDGCTARLFPLLPASLILRSFRLQVQGVSKEGPRERAKLPAADGRLRAFSILFETRRTLRSDAPQDEVSGLTPSQRSMRPLRTRPDRGAARVRGHPPRRDINRG